MILQEILNAKGTVVHRIGSDRPLTEVVSRLFEQRIGSLVVCNSAEDQPELVGIITERDVLRAMAQERDAFSRLTVADYMTKNLSTAAPTDDVAAVMGLMTERRIRHLPVLDHGALIGIISIGDVVKAQHDQMVLENHYLKSYVNGGITADV